MSAAVLSPPGEATATETVIGLHLSDKALFSRIDTTRPSLEGIAQVRAAGDWATARALSAAEVRRTLQPDRYLSIDRTWGGHSSMREGETCAGAAERIVRGELISCNTPHQFEGEVDWTVNLTCNRSTL